MAQLSSPGISVSVIDESFYTPAAPGTVPLIVVASAQDKANASGTGTATGTMKNNAGKVYVITSQRDLTDTFGTPLFYTDNSGNPLHGNELNEYGLQAAYSLLGVSSKAYVVRADLDLGQLVPTAIEPAGDPISGTYWVNTQNTLFGIFEWNSTTQTFKNKSPIVIDNSNYASLATSGEPKDSVGQQGNYAIYVTSENLITLWYKKANNTWVQVEQGFDSGKQLQISPHYQYPEWDDQTDNGSVWIKTTAPGLGANWAVSYFNGATMTWKSVSAPLYSSTVAASYALDAAGGGSNIPVGTLYVDSNVNNLSGGSRVADFAIWRRHASSPTTVVFATTVSTQAAASTFTIRETLANQSNWSSNITVTVPGSGSIPVAELIPAALSASGIVNVTATYDEDARTLVFRHALGGDVELLDGTHSPLSTSISTSNTAYPGWVAYNPSTGAGTPNLYAAPTGDSFTWLMSNWRPLVFQAQANAPTSTPEDGTLWFNNTVDEVDILVNDGNGNWRGYRNVFPLTDKNGPIIASLEPTTQSDGGSLATGDIWISTANMERYGKDIYVYNAAAGMWVEQDTTDQTSPSGWLFGDARWADSGQSELPTTIKKLLVNDYVDSDTPDPALYPKGMRLWNTRRSGFNVKKYIKGYININANNGANPRYTIDGPDVMNGQDPYMTDKWVSQNNLNEDGSGRFGRWAQRGFVVAALKATLDTNQGVRDTDTVIFNLMATPGYPEAIQNMIALNTDRGQTAFVVGDTPFRLEPTGTSLAAWGNNTALALDNNDDGGISYDSYMAMFYPSGYTSDNAGNNIVVPPSHMMLRTIVNSDAKSYPWFAPAGLRRGGVDNATSVGYINALTSEFQTVSLHQGLRDVLAGVKINPIATLPGAGIVNFGQYTRQALSSSLDRINVARLVAFLRYQLGILAKPYLFEPNDAQTRREMKAAADSLLLELVGQRALYDFVVVCDTSNNTPARIDRSELWLDIAIEPVKAVEFIYIPLRIKKTGAIAAGV
jgi:hypothetical protein